ncbi:MAG: RIP metalloprotease RseP [candidate division NC10 bacterium]|nr:RIP metalloprotease RseP [candidate division NC10 bacterium]MCZ6551365.1 RIP metalloprotease RseP [candidate division NC10 bacterium]
MSVDSIFWFLIMLGLLIFVHELGHFVVAKRVGVGVLKFSLGFGRRLFGFKKGETEYQLSAIPLGGYVKMVGEDPREVVIDDSGRAFDGAGEPLDLEKSFAHKSVWTRIAVVLAGPGSNFLLAVLLFWGVYTFVGRPIFPPVVGKPEAGSAAVAAGLQPRDRIVAAMGNPVRTWEEVDAAIQASRGEPVKFSIERDGVRRDLTVTPRRRTFTDLFGDEQQVWAIGVGPFISTTVGQVREGFPAAEAGMRAGDRIVAVNREPVETWDELQRQIHTRAGEEVSLMVDRGGERFPITITPKAVTQQDFTGRTKSVGLIGIIALSEYERMNPLTALYHASAGTVAISVKVVRVLVKIVEGAISPRTIGGPILIAQMTGEQVQQGFDRLIFLTAILSINLGVLNLLPIPILDGGHLSFFFIEMLRGRPVSVKKREMAQRVGLVLLVALMIFAFYNDIFRLLGYP